MIKHRYQTETQLHHEEIVAYLLDAMKNFSFQRDQKEQPKAFLLPYDYSFYIGLLQSITFNLLSQINNHISLIYFVIGIDLDNTMSYIIPKSKHTDAVFGKRIPIDTSPLTYHSLQKDDGRFHYNKLLFNNLPFLRVLIDDFRILPIIVNTKQTHTSHKALWKTLGSIPNSIGLFFGNFYYNKKNLTEDYYANHILPRMATYQKFTKAFPDYTKLNLFTSFAKFHQVQIQDIVYSDNNDSRAPNEQSKIFGVIGC